MPLNEVIKWATDLIQGADESNKESIKVADKAIAETKARILGKEKD